MEISMARIAIALLLAVATSLFVTWLPIGVIGSAIMKIGAPESVITLWSTLLAVLRHLLPGFLVGLIVLRHTALVGGVLSGLAGAISTAWAFSDSPISLGPADALQALLEFSAYGFIAAAAGAHLRLRANYSFKPRPLRGSA